MYEVERKLRVVHADLRDRLEDLPAEFLGAVEQRDTYFDHPTRAFATTDEALRLRAERAIAGDLGPTDRLTYKGPRLEHEAKTRREIETPVGRAGDARAILEALDFEPVDTVEKTRERYRTERAIVCLDAVTGLGEFVEIEAEAGDDIEAASAATDAVVEALGLSEAPEITRSYLGLLLDE